MAYPLQPISITASTTLTEERHGNGAMLVLNAAAGLTITLPDATGSGAYFYLVVGTTVTSNNYIIAVPDANNIIQGAVMVASDIAGVTCPTTTTSDTITMNGTTTGGIKGSYVQLTDIAADTWAVTGSLVSSGVEATPFSAAV